MGDPLRGQNDRDAHQPGILQHAFGVAIAFVSRTVGNDQLAA
jgi:hypothetical protein